MAILIVLGIDSSVFAEKTVVKSYKLRITIPNAVGLSKPFSQNLVVSKTGDAPVLSGSLVVEETTRGAEKIVLQSMVFK